MRGLVPSVDNGPTMGLPLRWPLGRGVMPDEADALGPIRGLVAARSLDPGLADDLGQELLVYLWERRPVTGVPGGRRPGGGLRVASGQKPEIEPKPPIKASGS